MNVKLTRDEMLTILAKIDFYDDHGLMLKINKAYVQSLGETANEL